ncbi:MAG: single stranded DNA-binding domain-containing protein, partial [Planctomycetota bacterium]
RLRFQNWTNKEGQNRNKLDVVVENFTFLGGGQRAGVGSQGGSSQAASDQAPPVMDDVPPMDSDEIPF